ncbi:NAD(P)-dependent oxidoreductase [Chromobacterium aquaticum]|uniref:NAD(P)-dependent oxidoreductase n=1 Tax=Chromobacterium aquaticum TaxID=467180 RepID=A0ABV8ZTN2_9NEIS|nr:NAD(P)-dependent oxidoreductase [Chromobacterium aquaticum]MCD5360917.1 NAD(P)-dependent oxidoreductase [Chromobacterium aquaticum]
MKIALIGASGFVGSAILQELLARKHQVSAIVTNLSKLPQHPQLSGVAADAYQASQIAAAVAGHDAVISAFNPGWDKADIQALAVKGHDTIVAGVKQARVKRFLEVGGAGSLEVAPGVQLVDTPEFPAEWKEGALGVREALRRLREENALDWTFVSPPAFLHPGERSGKYRLGGDQLLFNGDKPADISVEDLAVAIVDELEKPQHLRRRFTAAAI